MIDAELGALERAVSEQPTVEGWARLARALERLDRPADEALEAWAAALALDPACEAAAARARRASGADRGVRWVVERLPVAIEGAAGLRLAGGLDMKGHLRQRDAMQELLPGRYRALVVDLGAVAGMIETTVTRHPRRGGTYYGNAVLRFLLRAQERGCWVALVRLSPQQRATIDGLGASRGLFRIEPTLADAEAAWRAAGEPGRPVTFL